MTIGDLWAMPGVRLALGLVFGAIFGSFLGAAVVRLPLGISPLRGRSRCDGCGRVLKAADLVPIASYLLLRGRCRGCGAPIDAWQPAAELGGALVGLSAALAADSVAGFGWSLLLGMQLLLLGLLDARHLWLPDRLVLLLALTGFAAGCWLYGLTPAFLDVVVAGGLLGFALLWLPRVLYRRARGREGMGAGDPKLMAALGLWLGPLGVVLTLLGASLGGLALAVGLALSGRKVDSTTALPFGSALALAGWVVWLGTDGVSGCC